MAGARRRLVRAGEDLVAKRSISGDEPRIKFDRQGQEQPVIERGTDLPSQAERPLQQWLTRMILDQVVITNRADDLVSLLVGDKNRGVLASAPFKEGMSRLQAEEVRRVPIPLSILEPSGLSRPSLGDVLL